MMWGIRPKRSLGRARLVAALALFLSILALLAAMIFGGKACLSVGANYCADYSVVMGAMVLLLGVFVLVLRRPRVDVER